MPFAYKPGDRVRSKETGRFGTVVAVVDVGAAGSFFGGARASQTFGAAPLVRVEWDGPEGPAGSAMPDEIYAIRPPPEPWPAPAW